MKLNKILSCILAVILSAATVFAVLPVYASTRSESENIPAAADVTNRSAANGKAMDVLITMGKDESTYNLTWSSDSESPEYIQWAEADKVIDGVMPADCYCSDQAEKTKSSKRIFSVRSVITGLKSETAYCYRVGSDSTGWSEIYDFTTAKFEDRQFSFLFVGDPQLGASGSNEYDAVNWASTMSHVTNWFGDDIEFMMSAGDQVNYSDDVTQYRDFMAPEIFRSLPIITAVGNHDNGQVYSDYLTYTDTDPETASDAGRFGGDYWVAYDGALIMVLNMNRYSNAAHKAFMEKAIAEYTAIHGEPVWTIVAFHQPIYSAGGRATEDDTISRRNELSPIFSQLGVDVVLAGHDHVYTRSYMINSTTVIDDADLYKQVGNDPYGSVVDPAAGDVFYLTANSSSGSKFYDLHSIAQPFAARAMQENVPNITKVDVTGDSIHFTTYRAGTGNTVCDIADFFAIHRTPDVDRFAPTITAPESTYYNANEKIDLLEGITAYDNVDGDLTANITVDSTGDPTTVTTVTYTVTDTAGNTATAARTMIPLIGSDPVNHETTEWRVLDDGTHPFGEDDFNNEWTLAGYDDSAWWTGTGRFGARNNKIDVHDGIVPENLLHQYFPVGHDDEGYNIPNMYFRTTFDLKDPANVGMIIGDVLYDDGCDVYINGVKVAAFNTQLAQNGFGYNAVIAPSDTMPGSFVLKNEESIKALNLKEKGNVLAVHLFQAGLQSDDIFFSFENLYFGNTRINIPFTDIDNTQWYYPSVARAYIGNLFVGTTDTTFSPHVTMSRAMSWMVLAKIAGADVSTDGIWYEGARKWAMDNGVSDGTNPNNLITREQMAVMMYNLKGKPQLSADLSGYTDADSVSPWATEGMIWATSTGLMVGKGNGVLDPNAGCTRAEACALLIRYIDM